ncbi:MAG: hypothetical protein EBX50_07280 [Chitinophagia bacterium]|nr:hypothetical protein [Chitinophagia bacterium]
MSVYLVEINSSNKFKWRLTPWDAKVFGVNTLEVLDFICDNLDNGRKLIIEFLDVVRCKQIGFAYLRLPSNDRLARLLFEQEGFYLAEISVELKKTGLHKYNLKFPYVELLPLKADNIEAVAGVKEIAYDSFDFGRFHDDILIDLHKSRLRYFNWIDDLLKHNVDAYYIKHRNEIVGFHFQQVQGKCAELILTGCRKGYSTLAIPLWHSVFEKLKKSGVNECTTMISASNSPIINLYTIFQFKATRSLLGLHKHFISKHAI